MNPNLFRIRSLLLLACCIALVSCSGAGTPGLPKIPQIEVGAEVKLEPATLAAIKAINETLAKLLNEKLGLDANTLGSVDIST